MSFRLLLVIELSPLQSRDKIRGPVEAATSSFSSMAPRYIAMLCMASGEIINEILAVTPEATGNGAAAGCILTLPLGAAFRLLQCTSGSPWFDWLMVF